MKTTEPRHKSPTGHISAGVGLALCSHILLIPIMVKHKTVFVSLAPGSSICSAQVGLFRKAHGRAVCLGKWGGPKGRGTKAGLVLCCFFFFLSLFESGKLFFSCCVSPFFSSFLFVHYSWLLVVSRESLSTVSLLSLFFFFSSFFFQNSHTDKANSMQKCKIFKFHSV